MLGFYVMLPAPTTRTGLATEPGSDDELFPDDPQAQGHRSAGRTGDRDWRAEDLVFRDALIAAPKSMSGKSLLDVQLDSRCDSVTRVLALSENQRAKLRLAGQGDVRRFLTRVEELQRVMDLVGADPQRRIEALQELSLLQDRLQIGLFGPSSLFQKVLAEIQDEPAGSGPRPADTALGQIAYRKQVAEVAVRIAQAAQLSPLQEQRLVARLSDTPPPAVTTQYVHYYVLWHLSRIPERELKALFDEPQWQIVRQHREQGERVSAFLRSHGMIADNPLDSKQRELVP